jgi:sulfide dehydrogenase cytochrome subunit
VGESVISDQKSVIRKFAADHWLLVTGHWFAAACLFALTLAVSAAPVIPPSGAASCTGCHAADPKIETRVPRIAGRPAAEIVAAMEAFRSGQKPATVMDRIAKGFTDAEIHAIADWLGAQK